MDYRKNIDLTKLGKYVIKNFFRQNSMHSGNFENGFENEPLFAPISQNELTPEAVSDSLKEAEKGGDTGIEISGENMLERGKEIEAIIGNNYVESVMRIQLAEFTAPQDVANPAGSYLCMIMMITKERID